MPACFTPHERISGTSFLYDGLLRRIVGGAQVRAFCLPQQDRPSSPPCSFSLAILQNQFFWWGGGDSLLFILLAVGVCACVNVIPHAGDATDAGDDDDQDDE